MSDWVKEVSMKDWSRHSPLFDKIEWWGFSDRYGMEKNRTGHPFYKWKWFIIVQNRAEESPNDRGYFIYDTLHSTRVGKGVYYGNSWNNDNTLQYYFPTYSPQQIEYLAQAISQIQKKIVREHFIKKHGSYQKGWGFAEKEANKKSVYNSRMPKEESVTLYKNYSNFGSGFRTLNMAKRFCEELYRVQIMIDVCQSIINYGDALYSNAYDFANQVVGRNFNLSFEEGEI